MAVKLTVNLPDSTAQAIREIANQRGTSVTEALRQVIDTQHFLQQESTNGNSLLIQNPKDKTVREVIFNIPPRTSTENK
jgi:Ribbon-helix-helix protein, copG family